MRTELLLIFAASLIGCGIPSRTGDSAAPRGGSSSTEVRQNGTPAKSVYVTYSGPEHLTKRFSAFFSIAADDYGIRIANRKQDADAFMDVTITEKELQTQLQAEILAAGLLVRSGKTVTVHYCEGVNPGKEEKLSFMPDYSSLYAQGLVAELKKREPGIASVSVEPIKGNVDAQFLEVLQKELAAGGLVSARNDREADAVLRTVGTLSKPFTIIARQRRTIIEITGSANYKYSGTEVFYKQVQLPLPADAEVCRDAAQQQTSSTNQLISDRSWNTAATTAKALAKM